MGTLFTIRYVIGGRLNIEIMEPNNDKKPKLVFAPSSSGNISSLPKREVLIEHRKALLKKHGLTESDLEPGDKIMGEENGKLVIINCGPPTDISKSFSEGGNSE